MRGLKQARILALHNEAIVASFTDAWIETITATCKITVNPSHLLQMRGLKQKGSRERLQSYGRIFYRCVD